jgi:hypothetical protein
MAREMENFGGPDAPVGSKCCNGMYNTIIMPRAADAAAHAALHPSPCHAGAVPVASKFSQQPRTCSRKDITLNRGLALQGQHEKGWR